MFTFHDTIDKNGMDWFKKKIQLKIMVLQSPLIECITIVI